MGHITAYFVAIASMLAGASVMHNVLLPTVSFGGGETTKREGGDATTTTTTTKATTKATTEAEDEA